MLWLVIAGLNKWTGGKKGQEKDGEESEMKGFDIFYQHGAMF